MQFYGHSYWEALALPMKTFWLMSGNIDRIQAQKDMRSFTTAMAAQANGEEVVKYRQRLIDETGAIVKLEGVSANSAASHRINEERDEQGFAELKELSLMM